MAAHRLPPLPPLPPPQSAGLALALALAFALAFALALALAFALALALAYNWPMFSGMPTPSLCASDTMSTVQAFNTMLKSFLEELVSVFPEETRVSTFLESFDTLVELDARKPLQLFVAAITPHAQLAMAKDPALFDHLEFPGGIDFKRMWAADISDATREAIWQHINLLFLLGTTVQAMPPEMLESIETVAKNCADQVQNGQLDFTSLGNMLMSNGGLGGLGGLGSLGGLGGLGSLAALAGSDDADDTPDIPEHGPRRARPNKKKRRGGS